MSLAAEMRLKAAELERAAQQLRAAADALDQSEVAANAAAALPGPSSGADARGNGLHALIIVLREAGSQALSRREIKDRLSRKGFGLTESTIMTYLSRYPNFRKVSRDKWTLADNYDAARAAAARDIQKAATAR